MSREDDLLDAILDWVREELADIERKEGEPSEWLTALGEMCDELDALRDLRKTTEVLEMLRA